MRFILFAAVVSAILVNRFGEWKVITAGGLLACLGLGLSVPATHVYHLYVTYGVLAGEYTCLLCFLFSFGKPVSGRGLYRLTWKGGYSTSTNLMMTVLL